MTPSSDDPITPLDTAYAAIRDSILIPASQAPPWKEGDTSFFDENDRLETELINDIWAGIFDRRIELYKIGNMPLNPGPLPHMAINRRATLVTGTLIDLNSADVPMDLFVRAGALQAVIAPDEVSARGPSRPVENTVRKAALILSPNTNGRRPEVMRAGIWFQKLYDETANIAGSRPQTVDACAAVYRRWESRGFPT